MYLLSTKFKILFFVFFFSFISFGFAQARAQLQKKYVQLNQIAVEDSGMLLLEDGKMLPINSLLHDEGGYFVLYSQASQDGFAVSSGAVVTEIKKRTPWYCDKPLDTGELCCTWNPWYRESCQRCDKPR